MYTDIETARVTAGRIGKTIENMETEYDDTRIPVTVSPGIAEYDDMRDRSSRSPIDRAEGALYHSKQSGRNQVSAAS